MQLFLRDNKSVGFLIVLRYVILVLQGTIYNPVFAPSMAFC